MKYSRVPQFQEGGDGSDVFDHDDSNPDSRRYLSFRNRQAKNWQRAKTLVPRNFKPSSKVLRRKGQRSRRMGSTKKEVREDPGLHREEGGGFALDRSKHSHHLLHQSREGDVHSQRSQQVLALLILIDSSWTSSSSPSVSTACSWSISVSSCLCEELMTMRSISASESPTQPRSQESSLSSGSVLILRSA